MNQAPRNLGLVFDGLYEALCEDALTHVSNFRTETEARQIARYLERIGVKSQVHRMGEITQLKIHIG